MYKTLLALLNNMEERVHNLKTTMEKKTLLEEHRTIATAALILIAKEEGAVCKDYPNCTHSACESSVRANTLAKTALFKMNITIK